MMEKTLMLVWGVSLWMPVLTTVTVSPVHRSTSGSDEYTISFRTPNITITNNNFHLCVAARIPDELRDSYITKVVPSPDEEAYAHLVVNTCDDPGFEGRHEDEEFVWDCGSDDASAPTSGLSLRGSECATSSSSGSFIKFVSQWQSGSVEEDTFTLPDGMGVPVRGTEGHPKFLVTSYHYPRTDQTTQRFTGANGITVSLVANPNHIKLVDNFVLHAAGFVSGNSVETVTASWTLDQDIPIQPVLLYTHWHTNMTTDIQVWRQKSTGEKTLILHQDPHAFWGVSPVTHPESALIQPGDKITVSCTYNNTSPDVLTVFTEVHETCILDVAYAVEGNRTLAVAEVYSADPRFVRCFESEAGVPGMVYNDEGHSQFPGQLTNEECMALGRQ